MDTNLLNMFKSTYGGAMREQEAFANEQRSKQAAAQLNEASALESMFRTKRGEQMLPYDVSKAKFDTSPEMQQATLGKSQAEARKLKAEADTALANLDDRQLTKSFREGLAINKGVVSSLASQISSGTDVRTALEKVVNQLPEKYRGDPKLKQMIQKYSNLPPQEALRQASAALEKITELEAQATDPQYVRDVLRGKQQMEQTRLQGQYQVEGDRIRAVTGGGRGSESNSEAISRLWSEYNDPKRSPEERNAAAQELNYRSRAGEEVLREETPIGPQTKIKARPEVPLIPTGGEQPAPPKGQSGITYEQYFAAWQKAPNEQAKRELTQKAIELGIAHPTKKRKD